MVKAMVVAGFLELGRIYVFGIDTIIAAAALAG
jgi:hypothetical protein